MGRFCRPFLQFLDFFKQFGFLASAIFAPLLIIGFIIMTLEALLNEIRAKNLPEEEALKLLEEGYHKLNAEEQRKYKHYYDL
jgi:hypothetical protein